MFMNNESSQRVKLFKQEAAKFLLHHKKENISEEDISLAVDLINLGYMIAVKKYHKSSSTEKRQNMNFGIISSEWGQTT